MVELRALAYSIAKALGEQKMNIVLADIDEKNLLKSSAELESLGIPVLAALLDVADEMQWNQLLKKQWNDLVRFIWLLIMPVLAATQDL